MNEGTNAIIAKTMEVIVLHEPVKICVGSLGSVA